MLNQQLRVEMSNVTIEDLKENAGTYGTYDRSQKAAYTKSNMKFA